MRSSGVFKAVALAAAALLSACTGQQSAGQTSSTAPALRNPLDFPLYQDSNIVTSREFTQRIQAQNSSGDSVFASGNGTYSGHEVIASSPASFEQLSDWVQSIANAPPSGYSSVETGSNPQERAQAERYGIDYALFEKKTGNHTRGLLVIVMDPQRMNERFGTLLGMISRYRSLPAVMRAPIDNEAKARIGMTLSDATAPESPIGAALAALNQFQNKDARGIVVVDAAKH